MRQSDVHNTRRAYSQYRGVKVLLISLTTETEDSVTIYATPSDVDILFI